MSMGRSRGGSSVWTGCQVAVWALLIPWLLTAAMISLLPRFSYGLLERWVCPADSSIRVEGTAGWFFAVMADDDSVDVPQFKCVNSRGAVVLRGDSGRNWLAYLRVVGVVLLAAVPLEVVAFTVIETTSRKNGGPLVSPAPLRRSRASRISRQSWRLWRQGETSS